MIRYSLIMPTFNSAAWLPQVLGSLGPLGSDWEIIVVDDCSQDATVTLLQQPVLSTCSAMARSTTW